ncbi:arylsulfatase B-like [Littorina saxatilis]|uniref:Sulfatase N-terminal domain-containing protein n=1 Tax=Littorina saxatilis TaxID=31220 RepID=A0AAN9BMF3_9CAEN
MTRTLKHILAACLLLMTLLPSSMGCQKPNIVLILLQEAGWGDFESHDPIMRTPNIKKLREEGLFLSQSYVQPMCGPTIAALMSGRYPHTFGCMEGKGMTELTKFWVNETFTLLPQELKTLGYSTHLVGKWHLGFCHPGLMPQARGFDTFYGQMLGGHKSQYYHNSTDGIYDFWEGRNIDWTAEGHYKTDLYNARALKVLNETDSSKPFFLFLSHYVGHKPFEVPQHYRDTFCSHVTNEKRKTQCAMFAAADQGIGQIVQALKDKGVYDNTVILTMSDNGGPALEGGSVNWPLRGTKQTIFEGGTRSYTVFKAPGLTATNVTWSGLIHAIDWLPTLLGIAEGPQPNYIHGHDLWPNLQRNEPSARNEFIYAVNDFDRRKHSAFRYKQWKLIKGRGGSAAKSGWFPPFQLYNQYPFGGLDKTKFTNESKLYNLDTDPSERNNTYSDPNNAALLVTMEAKIKEYLVGEPGAKEGLYPLQPFAFYPVSSGDNVDQTGALATCFCQPPGLAGSTDCPTTTN